MGAFRKTHGTITTHHSLRRKCSFVRNSSAVFYFSVAPNAIRGTAKFSRPDYFGFKPLSIAQTVKLWNNSQTGNVAIAFHLQPRCNLFWLKVVAVIQDVKNVDLKIIHEYYFSGNARISSSSNLDKFKPIRSALALVDGRKRMDTRFLTSFFGIGIVLPLDRTYILSLLLKCRQRSFDKNEEKAMSLEKQKRAIEKMQKDAEQGKFKIKSLAG